MRRLVLLGFLAFLGACSVDVANAPDDPAGGYEMQVAANEGVQYYLVTTPDGERAAAKIENGVSSMVDANEARLAFGEARAAVADMGPPPEDDQVNIRLPGFELSVAGDDSSEGRAQVAVKVAGREVHVDATGEGETDQALVHVTGASASDARDFVNEQEDLSPETKSQMLAALGLTEATQ